MQGAPDVLLLTGELDTERAVALASELAPEAYARIVRCRDLRELGLFLERESVPIALVDIDPQPMAALAHLAPLARRFPDTRMVVLCREFRSDVVLEAMQIGARHCLVKGSISTDLPAVLRRLSRDSAGASEPRGSIVTVLSASGGCGATTLAVSLADELGLASGEPALLVDLDAVYGAASTYLGLRGEYGVVDVLEQRGIIDAQLVRSTASVYSDSLHVLLSPAGVDFSHPAPVSYERLDATLAACGHAYANTVIDAPRVPMEIAAQLCGASRLTLVVMELSVLDVRNARSILSALVERGLPRDAILAVANRYRRRNPMLSLEDAREALGESSVATVHNDFPSALRSVNFGQPLSKAAPRSRLRRDVAELAARVGAPLRAGA